MTDKIFKNLDEQIEILKNKGITISNEEQAKDILLHENYFFLNGYRQIFKNKPNDPTFIKGTTFEELYSMFIFDRKVRNIMFKNLLIIENNIKSIISYQLSKKYGYKEKDYLNPKNFIQDNLKVRQVKDVINKIKRQVRSNAYQHRATMHYIDNYGYIPMWVLAKVLSFGMLAELYAILKYEDQLSVADIYHLRPETLTTYLSILSNYRNLCAHEDILYDNRTQKSISNTKVHTYLNIEQNEEGYKYGKNDLFALVIIMKDMLNKDQFRELINEVGYEIDYLDGKINAVTIETILDKISFPNNWRDILNIE